MGINRDKVYEGAMKFLAQGRFDKGVDEFKKLLAEDPNDTRTLLKVAETLNVKLGNRREALEHYARAAQIFTDGGFFLKAVAVFKQMLQVDVANADLHMKLAELYQQLGYHSNCVQHYSQVVVLYEQQGRGRDTLAILKRMVDLEPDNLASRIKLGELFAQHGMQTEAAHEMRQALTYLKNQQRVDDAVRVGEKVLLWDPNALDVARELANIYMARNDARQALAKLQMCFRADPRNLELLELIASAFLQLDQAPKSISVFKEMARIHEGNGNAFGARTQWERVLEYAPDDDDAMTALGRKTLAPSAPLPPKPNPEEEQLQLLLKETDVYVKYGLRDKAVEHLDRIFAIRPEFLPGLEKLRALQVAKRDPGLAQTLQRLIAKGTEANHPKVAEWSAELARLAPKAAPVAARAPAPAPATRRAPLPDDPGLLLEDEDDDDNQATIVRPPPMAMSTPPGHGMGRSSASAPMRGAPAGSLRGSTPSFADVPPLVLDDEPMGSDVDLSPTLPPDVPSPLDAPVDHEQADALLRQALDFASTTGEIVLEDEASIPSQAPETTSAGEAPAASLHAGGATASAEAVSSSMMGMNDDERDAMDAFVASPLSSAPAPLASVVGPAPPFEEPVEGPGEEPVERTMFAPPPEPDDVDDFSDRTIAYPLYRDDGRADPLAAVLAVRQARAGMPVRNGFAELDDPSLAAAVAEPIAPRAPRAVPALPSFADAPPVDDDDSASAPATARASAAATGTSAPATNDAYDDAAAGFDDDSVAPPSSTPAPAIVAASYQRAWAAAPVVAPPPVLDEDDAGNGFDDGRVIDSTGAYDLMGVQSIEADAFEEVPRSQAPADAPMLEDAPAHDDVPAPSVPAASVHAGRTTPSMRALAFEDDPVNTFFADEIVEAEFFVDQGLFDEAREIVEPMLEEFPDSARVQHLLARIAALEAGEPEPPLPAGQRILDEVADEIDGLPPATTAPPAFAEVSVEVVLSQFKKGVAEIVPDEDAATHYDLGIAYREMGLHEDAIGEFLLVARAPARAADARYLIGLARMDQGRFDDAVSAFNDAIATIGATRDQQAACHYQRGICLEQLGRIDDAIVALQASGSLGGNAADLERRLSQLQGRGGPSRGRKDADYV